MPSLTWEVPLLLAIDIGNTNMVLGVFDGDQLVEHWRLATVADRTADELAVVLHGLLDRGSACSEKDIDGISLCSTVPSVLHEMRLMCRRYYPDLRTLIVEPGVKTGVPVRTDNPKEAGSDRIMNSLAAVHLYGGPAVVVDFGTATNFDAVSAQGEYVGGALAPGIEISVDALSRRAAQLLKVELVKPAHVIGKTTVECLQSGIIYGFAGQVEGIVRRMAAELSPADPDAVKIIATGGLAPLVIGEVAIIDAYEPWLTLIGLRLVYEKNADLLDPHRADVVAPVNRLDQDALAVRGGIHHEPVADIDPDVADVGVEEDQISWLQVVLRDVHAGVPQVAGVVRQRDAELAERPHDKA
jgi:type III pantothenate kinase